MILIREVAPGEILGRTRVALLRRGIVESGSTELTRRLLGWRLFMKHRVAVYGILLVLGMACGPAGAVETLLVDRGLPNANLNSASGVLRSNVSWNWPYDDPPFPYRISGDTFVLPTPTEGYNWTVDTIRTWSPAIPIDSTDSLGDIYFWIMLYGKVAGLDGALEIKSEGGITGNSSDNPDIKLTHVYYDAAGNPSYEGQDGAYWQIWQIDFTNLNWVVPPSEQIQFGVDALGSDYWYNHASNAGLGGVPAQGADGSIWYFSATGDLPAAIPCDSNYPDGENSIACQWDKSSDINVQVYGHAPEPGALWLTLAGLFGLHGVRRRWA